MDKIHSTTAGQLRNNKGKEPTVKKPIKVKINWELFRGMCVCVYDCDWYQWQKDQGKDKKEHSLKI